MRVRPRSLFAALALLVTLAVLPALDGGWVYDDRLMIGHPLLNTLGAIPATFRRNSADFQARGRGNVAAIEGAPT